MLCLQFLIFDTQQRTLGVPLLTLLVWGVGAMFVTVRAATAIGSERSGQTLDVLLTTPLTGREILLQKMAGVRRLMIVVSMPILTAAAFTMYLRGTTTPEAIRYGVWQAAQALIYLPLIAWVGVWIGLRIRRPTRAVFSAVATIAVWATVPFVLNYFRGIAASLAGIEGNLWMFVLNLASSPAAGLATNERTAYLPGGYKVITLHAAFYAAILFFVRSRVLRGVDRRLGRAAPPEKPADHARLQAMADESPTLAEASHAI